MSFQSPEKLVADQVTTNTAVLSVMSNRIYPVLAPASATLPFAVWRRQAVQRQPSLGGPTGATQVTLAVDIYSETYQGVRTLSDNVRKALDGWGSGSGQLPIVNQVSLENEVDGFVQLTGGDLPPVYSVTQTYLVIWQEN
jgi:hypothetical protein